MSINVSNVIVVNPKGAFTDDIEVFFSFKLTNTQFDIEFACVAAISSYINWQVCYVGSATSHDYDQILANVLVGPIEIGVNRFVLRADPPKKNDDISPEDFSYTVIMLEAFYKEQEFIRIGYYVSNTIPEDAGDNPDPSKIIREILIEDTTVHQSQIKWD